MLPFKDGKRFTRGLCIVSKLEITSIWLFIVMALIATCFTHARMCKSLTQLWGFPGESNRSSNPNNCFAAGTIESPAVSRL